MTVLSDPPAVRSSLVEMARVERYRRGDRRTGLVLGAALTAMALIAGLFYSFAVAVMAGLAKADDRTVVIAMQRINKAIQNPAFFASFFGALVLTAAAGVLQRRYGAGAAIRWVSAALVLYVLALAVTFGINIPLNNDLDAAGNADRIADLAKVRDDFVTPWVASNIVRTLLSTAAVGCLARALLLHGRATAARPPT